MHKILPYIVWSIEHILFSKKFLGELWYKLWIKTPIDCSKDYCIFCMLERRKGLKTYCLAFSCKHFQTCKHNYYVVVSEKITLKEALKKYPNTRFCPDWEEEK